MPGVDPDEYSRRLAAESLGADDPTGWFERLYAQAENGDAVVPWDRGAPHKLLLEWGRQREAFLREKGSGHSALIVGCGLGDDAEYIAAYGFETVAFDISPTAVQVARRRFPDSAVRYVAADVLAPPEEWRGSYDLVIEVQTVQALPRALRAEATANIARMVAPGGSLTVVAASLGPGEDPEQGPPWPLTRADVEAFAAGELRAVRIDAVEDADQPLVRRWLAELHRPFT